MAERKTKSKRVIKTVNFDPEFYQTLESIAETLYNGNTSLAVRKMIEQSPQWTDRTGMPEWKYVAYKYLIKALRSMQEQYRQLWDLHLELLEGQARFIPEDFTIPGNRKS
jgi:hypothetical protein